MSRIGFVGKDIILESIFAVNGTPLDPYSVSGVVGIYDAEVGGNLLASLVPTWVESGTYTATWSVPSTQGTGKYYDEWTWIATSGLDAFTSRTMFELTNSFSQYSDRGDLYIEQRLETLETDSETVGTALSNLATRKELKNLLAVMQSNITVPSEAELTTRVVAVENLVNAIQTAMNNLVSAKQMKQYVMVRQQQVDELQARVQVLESQVELLQKK